MLGLRYAQELDGDIAAAAKRARLRLTFDHIGTDQPFSFIPAGSEEYAEAVISCRLGDHMRYLVVLRCVAHVLLGHHNLLVPRRRGLHWQTRCPEHQSEDAFMDSWLDWCTKPHTDRLRRVMSRAVQRLG